MFNCQCSASAATVVVSAVVVDGAAVVLAVVAVAVILNQMTSYGQRNPKRNIHSWPILDEKKKYCLPLFVNTIQISRLSVLAFIAHRPF